MSASSKCQLINEPRFPQEACLRQRLPLGREHVGSALQRARKGLQDQGCICGASRVNHPQVQADPMDPASVHLHGRALQPRSLLRRLHDFCRGTRHFAWSIPSSDIPMQTVSLRAAIWTTKGASGTSSGFWFCHAQSIQHPTMRLQQFFKSAVIGDSVQMAFVHTSGVETCLCVLSSKLSLPYRLTAQNPQRI